MLDGRGGPTVTAEPARPHEPSVASTEPGRRSIRIAWISVALIPVAFILAMVAGQALSSLLGYDSANGDAPPLAVLLGAALPAVLIMLAPTIPAIVFGFRARRQGVPSGLIPAVIGIAAAAWAILANTLPLLLGML
jgi:hypothetical protein